jgi:hypothetical protein
MTLTEYKGLPQGSVLSPFLYNLLGSGMDRLVPSGCDMPIQYADDIVVYSSHHVLQTACALPWFTRPARYSVFFFRCLDPRYLQSRRWYCSLGDTCGLRSRSRLVADCCHK